MHSPVIIGNAAETLDSSTKGWVVGHFIPEGLARRSDFEIKIWHYEVQPDYGQKLFKGTEFIIAEKGAIRLELEIPDEYGDITSCQVVLKGSTRDYVILSPGCKKRVLVTETPAYGITVRWPSVPGINVEVEKKT